MPRALPVTILTGFLGAGKTTLLNRILADPQGVRFGVLVNDFGAINIDAALVADQARDRISLANGCVCCSISDDLVAALQQLLDRDDPPDHVLIEASGVSRPLAIAQLLERPRIADRLRLDGIFALVDAAGFGELAGEDLELALDQAFSADMVIINKVDQGDEASLAPVEKVLAQEISPERILRAVHADIPRDLLVGPQGSVAGRSERPTGCEHVHDHAHDHDHAHSHDKTHEHAHAFASWAWTSAQPLELRAFRAAMRELPQELLRAKGILDIGGRCAIFQLVGRRKELQFVDGPPPATSQLVAIARHGKLDDGWLQQLMDGM